jgi:predicted phosphodiesterase
MPFFKSLYNSFRHGMQWLFKKPITRMADRFSSAPVKEAVFKSLDELLEDIKAGKAEKGYVKEFDALNDKIIILSDQHKGAKDAADDFADCEKNYLAALDYYYGEGYTLVVLGDCEELWENEPPAVMKTYKNVMQSELRYLNDNRYVRVFGNHDLEWSYTVPQVLFLKPAYNSDLKVYEGLLLSTDYNNKHYDIFLAHGHQGDQRSDGNAFSKWFVAAIWTPIQRFLEIKSSTLSTSFELADKHNIIMYEWSAAQQNMLFVSGHTHKPVFASLDHIDRLNKRLAEVKASGDAQLIKSIEDELDFRKHEYAGKQFHKTMVVPSYFNSGCCCYSDGDITGIEISGGDIRLIKWEVDDAGKPQRKVLEYSSLSYVFEELGATNLQGNSASAIATASGLPTSTNLSPE